MSDEKNARIKTLEHHLAWERDNSSRVNGKMEELKGQLSRTEATLSVAKAIIVRQSLEIEQLKSIVLSRDTDDSIDRLYEGIENDDE